jgi:hypothetical protein
VVILLLMVSATFLALSKSPTAIVIASRAILVTQIVTMIVATRPTLGDVQYCQLCLIVSPPAAAEAAPLPAVPI